MCSIAYLDYRMIFCYFAHANGAQPHYDNNVLLILEVFVFSYLVGSLPTAYIVVKRKAHIDIRSAGSGNVGTLNAYEVTGQRLVGFIVLVVDVLKGALAIILVSVLFGSTFEALSTALVGVVVGHCFPVWLMFKGGRGLAVAAGAMLIVSWIFVAMWLVCWSVGYSLSKNVHVGNIVAIVASPLLGFILPASVIMKFTIGAFSAAQILLIYSVMSVVLFIRHIEPLRALISLRTTNGK
ncbi:MAG: glycerol-3-phosphate acyltransferase [Bacteroidota bacterium]